MSGDSKAVFLSYASEDSEAAQRIAEALEAAGIEVWFDKSELRGGDAWDQKIRQQIRECGLFVPLISANTDRRSEGYFRLEWKLAVDRSHQMADDAPFLVPVVLDVTAEASARVPERFRDVQWTRLPRAEGTADFADRIIRLLGTSAEAPPAATAQGGEPPALARPGRSHARLTAVGAALLALAVAAVWYVHHRVGTGPADGGSTIAEKSIAVLPFENRSDDHAQDFYADGLTDELTTALSRISALKVVARNSSARFRGSDKRPSEVAHDLGVATLVTGAVLRAGNRVRYSATLVAADSERILWSESYDRDAQDVLTLQSEVARAITQAIAVRLSPVESERLADRRRVNPQAFDEYLLGRVLWNERTERSVRAALVHFENAAHMAPDLALAYAGIADGHILLGVYGFDPPRSAFPTARAAALRAIELDPHAGEPHASLGDILFHYDWDWRGSQREHETAIQLSPGFATAYQWSAETQVLNGDLVDALARVQRARALDPFSMIIRYQLADVLARLGRREQAVAELREAIAIDPKFVRTRWGLARQLLALGRTDEALTQARELAGIAPDSVPVIAMLGLCVGRAGDVAGARGILARLEAQRPERFVSSLELARIAAGLRDRDLTNHYLEQAVGAREGFLPFIGQDDEFEFLRDDQRFVAVTRAVGIPPRQAAAPAD